MLKIHFSNRFEILAARLMAEMASDTPADPFTPVPVIVPSVAVRRALTLAIATREGVCANVGFDFLARWLWQQLRASGAAAGTSPFAGGTLAPRLYALLGDLPNGAADARLTRYLGEADDLMRFELATRLAALYEQYATYRPDWLARWAAGEALGLGEDEAWQADLWRRLAAQLGLVGEHPEMEFIRRGAPDVAAGCAVHVFALPAIAPLHLRMIEAIARVRDVHLYMLNPCAEYWFELVDARRLAHLRQSGAAAHAETGNRLLAAWGKQTQACVDLLVETCGEAIEDDALFLAAEAPTLLARWQDAVLELTELEPGSVELAEDDRSVEVHVCHSLTRELEVLHDRLLTLFAADPALRPADVLVVTPDIEAAAPLIDAVFGTVPRDRAIAFRITGRARSGADAPARALLALLALLPSRFAASEVFAFVQMPIVARRFELAEPELEQLHEWIGAAGIRWALDADQRAGLGLPASADHSFSDGMARLFLGYALPGAQAEPFDEPFAGQLPAGDPEGSAASALGAFWSLVEALREFRRAARPQTAADWDRFLRSAVETLFKPEGDEIDEQRELIAAITQLSETLAVAPDTDLPLAVLRRALEEVIDDPMRGGVPTGAVTFSSMSSLRGLPFKLVCGIGLNDGAFPGAQLPAEFDLMARHPRRGDRQRRLDERNLFLDLLLAARERVHLSYTGRSIRDNSPLPPSVLVSEWLEVLTPAIAPAGASDRQLAAARRRLVVEHPLQAFALEAFRPETDARLRSHDAELAAALRASLAAPLAAPAALAIESDEADDDDGDEAAAAARLPAFYAAPLAPLDAAWRAPALEDLIEFFRQPCRYWIRHRLGIQLALAEEELADEEPFVLDRRASRALADALLPAALAGAASADLLRLALAGTALPAGALGTFALDAELARIEHFAQRLAPMLAAPPLPATAFELGFDLDGEDWRLSGALADLRAAGRVSWRYAPLYASDLLEAWIRHLALCAVQPAGVALRTQHVLAEPDPLCPDAVLRFGPVPDAAARLAGLMRLYRRGLQAPLFFFPRAAWAYVGKDQNSGKAAEVWNGSQFSGGESEDAAYRLALRGVGSALDDGDFHELALQVFAPLLANLKADGR